MRFTFEHPEVYSAVLKNGLESEGLSVQLMPTNDRLLFCLFFEISLLKSITMSSRYSLQTMGRS